MTLAHRNANSVIMLGCTILVLVLVNRVGIGVQGEVAALVEAVVAHGDSNTSGLICLSIDGEVETWNSFLLGLFAAPDAEVAGVLPHELQHKAVSFPVHDGGASRRESLVSLPPFSRRQARLLMRLRWQCGRCSMVESVTLVSPCS